MGGVSAAVLFLLELAGGRVSQIGLKGTRVSSIRTEVSLIRIKMFLFWRTDGCQATLFPKGTAQPLKRSHAGLVLCIALFESKLSLKCIPHIEQCPRVGMHLTRCTPRHAHRTQMTLTGVVVAHFEQGAVSAWAAFLRLCCSFWN